MAAATMRGVEVGRRMRQFYHVGRGWAAAALGSRRANGWRPSRWFLVESAGDQPKVFLTV
jgi:hypothetical protein